MWGLKLEILVFGSSYFEADLYKGDDRLLGWASMGIEEQHLAGLLDFVRAAMVFDPDVLIHIRYCECERCIEETGA